MGERYTDRLEKQGRLEEFLNQPVQLRDYSKVNFKVVNDYVKSIRENRLDGYYGGVHPSERKEFTEHLAAGEISGSGDGGDSAVHARGRSGQSGRAGGRHREGGTEDRRGGGFISSPVHSSVSGTVTRHREPVGTPRGANVCLLSSGQTARILCTNPYSRIRISRA